MDIKELYDYTDQIEPKTKHIGGWLILIASWNISVPLNILANISNNSQMKLAAIQLKSETLPDAFFEISKLGYMMLLPISLIMLYAFFKKMALYKYLEILNLVYRVIFTSIVCYILRDPKVIYKLLADNLLLGVIVSISSLVYLFASKRVKETFVN